MIYYHVLENEIILQVNGKHVSVKEDSKDYENVLECIRGDDMEGLEALFAEQKSPLDLLSEVANVTVENGMVLINGKQIPTELHNRLVSLARKSLPVLPLINFVERLQANPSFNSRQMLFAFLEHCGHPLTTDGKFIAYKKVNSEFKDIHTRTFDNSVGQIVKMPRDMVDDNPNNTCSSGLHVGAHNYTSKFGSGYLMLVEVDPKDVVAVPNDYNGEKMRVCEYKVIGISKEILQEDDLYEDDYDVLDDTGEFYAQ